MFGWRRRPHLLMELRTISVVVRSLSTRRKAYRYPSAVLLTLNTLEGYLFNNNNNKMQKGQNQNKTNEPCVKRIPATRDRTLGESECHRSLVLSSLAQRANDTKACSTTTIGGTGDSREIVCCDVEACCGKAGRRRALVCWNIGQIQRER